MFESQSVASCEKLQDEYSLSLSSTRTNPSSSSTTSCSQDGKGKKVKKKKGSSLQAPKLPHQWRQGRKRQPKSLVATLKGLDSSIYFTNIKGMRFDRDVLLSL